jgi:hypothetical protein
LTPEESKEARRVKKPTTPKPRRGSEARQRARQSLVRWDEEEWKAVDEQAARARLTVPSYLRQLALAEEKRKTRSTRRAPIERELLAKVLGQLGKIGSNLNQLAHAANLNRSENAKIMATVAELRRLLPPILGALGRKA